MKAVKRKLKSGVGASILISLMFFLVVMMVGAVCLVAAYNNSGRATHARDDVQQSAAVQSAIDLITEDMKAATDDDTDEAKFIITKGSSGFQVTIPKENQLNNNAKTPKYGKMIYDLMKSTFEPQDGNADYIIYDPTKLQGGRTISLSAPSPYDENFQVSGTVKVNSFISNEKKTELEDLDFTIELDLGYVTKKNEKTGAALARTYVTTITIPAYVRTVKVYTSKETVEERLEVSWQAPQLVREKLG